MGVLRVLRLCCGWSAWFGGMVAGVAWWQVWRGGKCGVVAGVAWWQVWRGGRCGMVKLSVVRWCGEGDMCCDVP